MRFLHFSDVHLGFQQYSLGERFNDFFHAFEHAIQYGIDNKVDAILIAGDLFHKSAIEPMVYVQAADMLKLARDADIPVIAISGNHDQASRRDVISWLDVLAHEGYLYFLEPVLQDETCQVPIWDKKEKTGAFLDIDNVRIIGLPYLGGTTALWLPAFSDAIANLPKNKTNFTILLTHAGIEGELGKLDAALSHAELEPLRKSVNYLGLGHLHKHFEQDNWLYNPGSLEVYDVGELKWSKGWYDVEVDSKGKKKVRYVPSNHRTFLVQNFQVGAYDKPADLLRAYRDDVRQWAAEWKKALDKPVVVLYLEGELAFDRHELDTQEIEKITRESADLLHVVVNTSKLRSPGLEFAVDESIPLEELEKTVLREIARGDSRFAAHPDEWASVILNTKQMAIASRSADEILSTLQMHIEKIEGMAQDVD